MFENIVPVSIKQFGKAQEHTELEFANSQGRKIRAISFFSLPEDFSYKPDRNIPMTLVASLEKSFFRNRPELRLRIIDIL